MSTDKLEDAMGSTLGDMATAAKPKQPDSKDPWAHRSKGMLCGSCMYYVPKQPKPLSGMLVEVGRCRRHAPSMNGYPVVFFNDWCGDHKLDENRT